MANEISVQKIGSTPSQVGDVGEHEAAPVMSTAINFGPSPSPAAIALVQAPMTNALVAGLTVGQVAPKQATTLDQGEQYRPLANDFLKTASLFDKLALSLRAMAQEKQRDGKTDEANALMAQAYVNYYVSRYSLLKDGMDPYGVLAKDDQGSFKVVANANPPTGDWLSDAIDSRVIGGDKAARYDAYNLLGTMYHHEARYWFFLNRPFAMVREATARACLQKAIDLDGNDPRAKYNMVCSSMLPPNEMLALLVDCLRTAQKKAQDDPSYGDLNAFTELLADDQDLAAIRTNSATQAKFANLRRDWARVVADPSSGRLPDPRD